MLFAPLRELDATSRFCRHRGRLALFRHAEQVKSYWHDYWQRRGKLQQLLELGERGGLGAYEALFSRTLRPEALTLEAGCGPAHVVNALHLRGYRVAGVDLDADVVGWVRAHY